MNSIKLWHETGKLRQELKVGNHRLVADEPIELGGEDTGPSPFDYLGTALASCTAITLRMYAQRKNWPLENAEVEVSLIREKELTRFTRTIHLIGNLDATQKERLLDIANRCPVHNILTGKVEINTSLV